MPMPFEKKTILYVSYFLLMSFLNECPNFWGVNVKIMEFHQQCSPTSIAPMVILGVFQLQDGQMLH